MNEFDPDGAATEGSGIFGLPHSVDESKVVVVPVPVEATTSYGGGTSRGPAAVFEASRQVDLFDRETGEPWKLGIALLEPSRAIARRDREAKRLAQPILEAGGRIGKNRKLAASLARVNEHGERVNEWVHATVATLLDNKKFPCVLGGDHSSPFGAIRAFSERNPGVGILHLDAHADLRNAFEGFTWSHASIFHNVMTRCSGVGRLVQVGLRDIGRAEQTMIDESGGRIVAFHDSDLVSRKGRGESWDSIADDIVSTLPSQVYLSWDIDGLDPALCPHTGTPVPGGLSWHEAIGLLRAVVRAKKRIVGLDLCEVAPGPRGDEWDANVGARLLYKMIGFALLSRR